MTELSREEVLVIARECGFEIKEYGDDKWLEQSDDLEPLERFAAAIYEAGAKSERAVSDRLLAAAKNLKLVRGRHRTEIAYLALEKVVAEVTAMRQERKEKPE